MSTRDPKSLRRVLLRLGAGVVILLALGGPTPGYVGTCSTDTPAVVDPEQFCVDRKSSECARDRVAGRTDEATYNACANMIESQCTGATWTNGCAPSPQLAGACISALRDMSRLATLNAMIEECYQETLCGTAPLVTPDGI